MKPYKISQKKKYIYKIRNIPSEIISPFLLATGTSEKKVPGNATNQKIKLYLYIFLVLLYICKQEALNMQIKLLFYLKKTFFFSSPCFLSCVYVNNTKEVCAFRNNNSYYFLEEPL